MGFWSWDVAQDLLGLLFVFFWLKEWVISAGCPHPPVMGAQWGWRRRQCCDLSSVLVLMAQHEPCLTFFHNYHRASLAVELDPSDKCCLS